MEHEVTSFQELLRDDKAAALCDIATRTFRRLVAARKAPQPIKINSLIRWRRSELLEWIDGGCLPIEEPTVTSSDCSRCGQPANHEDAGQPYCELCRGCGKP